MEMDFNSAYYLQYRKLVCIFVNILMKRLKLTVKAYLPCGIVNDILLQSLFGTKKRCFRLYSIYVTINKNNRSGVYIV